MQAIALRENGSAWVGGAFTTFNGTMVNYVALLNGDPIPLAITSQPAALTIVDPGEDVTLTVSAVGTTALSYQWLKKGSPLGDLLGVSGSQTNTLSLTGVDDLDNGAYSVEVTNEAGTVTSSTAQVVVLGAPQILGQSGDVTLLEGNALTLEVEALGAATLDYQWYRAATLLENQTSATLHIAPTSLDAAGTYTVIVTNSLGFATSDPINVTVQENQAAIAPGFVPPTIAGHVRQVYPLSGGKVLIGGDFTSASDGVNTSGARLAVVNADGSIEPVVGLSADSSVYAIRDGGEGKILIAGNFNTVNGETRRRVARLNADFSLDGDFDASDGFGQFGGLALDVAREDSGTIMVAGQFSDFNTDPAADYVVRLTATGAHDTSFTSGANSFVYRVFSQPDGKVVLAGWFSTWSGNAAGRYLVRTLANGSWDDSLTFATGSFDSHNDAHDLGDGRFLAAPGFLGATNLFDATGAKNASFLSQGQPNFQVSAFAKDGTGRILVGGNFTTITGASRNRIVRLTPEGLRDDTFEIGTGFDGVVEDILTAPEGSVWVGGNFTGYNGIPVQRLVRLKGSSGASPPADSIKEYYISAGIPEGLRGDDDDADNDQIANLIEYLYQTGPNDNSSRPQPFTATGTQTGAQLGGSYDMEKTYCFIDVELPKNRRGLNVEVQASSDLSGFGTGPAQAVPHGPPVDNGDTEIQRYIITPATDDAPSMFWRMAVER